MTTDLDKKTREIINKKNSAIVEFNKLLLEHDPHILTLFYSIGCLERAVDAIRQNDSDGETEDELKVIINRWTNEIGMRMVMFFNDKMTINLKDLGFEA